MLKYIIPIAAVLVLLIIWVISEYNKMVKLHNRVRNQMAQIDVALTERASLIPNLVNTVKGYAAHEKETLSSVVAARNSAVDAQTPQEKADADSAVTASLGRLFALSEQYPDLKADASFMSLQVTLKDLEKKIALQRQFYNDAVTKYQTCCQFFPRSIVAGIFGLGKEELFQASSADRAVPEVSF